MRLVAVAPGLAHPQNLVELRPLRDVFLHQLLHRALFKLKLPVIGEVLQPAAAASAKDRTARLDPLGYSFVHPHKLRALLFSAGDSDRPLLPGQQPADGKGHPFDLHNPVSVLVQGGAAGRILAFFQPVKILCQLPALSKRMGLFLLRALCPNLLIKRLFRPCVCRTAARLPVLFQRFFLCHFSFSPCFCRM